MDEADFIDNLGGVPSSMQPQPGRPAQAQIGPPTGGVDVPMPETTGGERARVAAQPSMRQQILETAVTEVIPSMLLARVAPNVLGATRPGAVAATRMLGAGGGAAGGVSAGQALGFGSDTPEGRYQQLLSAAGYGAAGEALGAGLHAVGGATARRGLNRAHSFIDEHIQPTLDRFREPRARAAREAGQARDALAMEEVQLAQDYLQERGHTLTAEQVAEYMAPSQRRNRLQFASGMLRETSPMKLAREGAQERVSLDVRQWIGGLGGSNPRAAAALANLAVTNSREAHRVATRGAWDALEGELSSLGSNVTVDIKPLWQAGAEELEKAGLAFRPGLRRMARNITQEGNVVTDPVFDWSGAQTGTLTRRVPRLAFDEAQQLRSALREAADGREVLPGVNRGFAQKLLGTLDEQIDLAEGDLAAMGRGDIVDLYHQAREMSRLGHTEFNNEIVRGWLANLEPEKVYASITSKGSPTRTAMMRRFYERGMRDGTLPDTAWQEVQNQWFRDMMQVGTGDDIRHTLQAKPVLDKMSEFRLSGVMDELFPGPVGHRSVDHFERLMRVLRVTEASSNKGGGLSLNVLQTHGAIMVGTAAGGAAGFGTGDVGKGVGTGAGAAGLILIGPRAFGRLMADPTFVNNLIRGVGGGSGQLASRTIGHLLTRAAQIQVEENLPDLLINQEALEKVDLRTGEIVPTFNDISLANRPQDRVEILRQGARLHDRPQ